MPFIINSGEFPKLMTRKNLLNDFLDIHSISLEPYKLSSDERNNMVTISGEQMFVSEKTAYYYMLSIGDDGLKEKMLAHFLRLGAQKIGIDKSEYLYRTYRYIVLLCFELLMYTTRNSVDDDNFPIFREYSNREYLTDSCMAYLIENVPRYSQSPSFPRNQRRIIMDQFTDIVYLMLLFSLSFYDAYTEWRKENEIIMTDVEPREWNDVPDELLVSFLKKQGINALKLKDKGRRLRLFKSHDKSRPLYQNINYSILIRLLEDFNLIPYMTEEYFRSTNPRYHKLLQDPTIRIRYINQVAKDNPRRLGANHPLTRLHKELVQTWFS